MLGKGVGRGGSRERAVVRVECVSRSWNNFDEVLIDERNVRVSLGRHEYNNNKIGRHFILFERSTKTG